MTLTDWPDLAAEASPIPRPAEEVQVYLPPLEVLARRWNEIEPMLRRSTERTCCYEPVDLLIMAGTGAVGMWLCMRGEAIDAVTVTQITTYPRRRVLEVLFTAGGNLAAWRAALVGAIDKHARDLGCSHVASAGRPGWVRAWGARATGDIIMVREL